MNIDTSPLSAGGFTNEEVKQQVRLWTLNIKEEFSQAGFSEAQQEFLFNALSIAFGDLCIEHIEKLLEKW